MSLTVVFGTSGSPVRSTGPLSSIEIALDPPSPGFQKIAKALALFVQSRLAERALSLAYPPRWSVALCLRRAAMRHRVSRLFRG